MRARAGIVALVGIFACATSQPAPGALMPEVTGESRNANGIRYIDVVAGTGAVAERNQCVYTHYTGWRLGGRKFDSSHNLLPSGAPGEPVSFVLGTGRVIRGWDAGIVGMREGGQRRLFIPSDLAYGTKGSPPLVPPDASLIFDIELVRVASAVGQSSCPPLNSIRGSD